MVKLKGPSFSTIATGTIAGTVNFSNWQGRAYLRKKPVPNKPTTPLQRGARVIWAFLSEEWAGLGAPAHATWEAPALAKNISPFNFYMKHNAARWKTGRSPSQIYPTPETDGFATWAQLPVIYGAVNSVRYYWKQNVQPYAWGLALYLSTTAVFDKDNTTLVKVHNAIPTGNFYHYWQTPLPYGQYWASARQFTKGGLIDAPVAETSAWAANA